MDAKNRLYFGDNLKILREYVPEASVDLIYLDPPFNSSATYTFSVAPLYERRRRRSQTGAIVSSAVYKEIVTSGPRKLADLMKILHRQPPTAKIGKSLLDIRAIVASSL